MHRHCLPAKGTALSEITMLPSKNGPATAASAFFTEITEQSPQHRTPLFS